MRAAEVCGAGVRQASKSSPQLSRRSMAAAVAVILSAPIAPARALIDFDEDDE